MLQIKHKQPGGSAKWLTSGSYDFGLGESALFKVGVLPLEARIISKNGSLFFYNMGRSAHVLVDSKPLSGEIELRGGMVISIGSDDFELLNEGDADESSPPADVLNEAAAQWSLIALNTPLAKKEFRLKSTQSIGRADYCDICLKVVHLSRRHAQITIEGGHLQVTDLNSSNGTYLNGKRITSAYVINGDELTFDTLKFTVVGPAPTHAGDRTALRVEPRFDADKTVARPILAKSSLKKAIAEQRTASEKQSSAASAVPGHLAQDDKDSAIDNLAAQEPSAVVKKTKIMQQAYQAQELHASKPKQQSQESGDMMQYIIGAIVVTILVSVGAVVYILF